VRLRHHVADAVAAGLGARFRHHVANLVAAGLLFPHHIAGAVAASLRTSLLYILGASDRASLHFRNPNLLANLRRRALALDRVALARAVDATAAARIPSPAARILAAFGDRRARAFRYLSFPVAAANL